MTWINLSPQRSEETITVVVPLPREVNALGAALSAAFTRPSALPTDLTKILNALDRIA